MEKMNKIKVAIRARPLLPKELEKGAVSEWTTSDRTIRRIGTSVEEFSFDHVFGESDDTMTVYEKTVHPIVETAMQGYNGTVFAYGQTSSGKTYTIMGNAEKRQPGLIHLVLDDIFDAIQQNVDREYLLRVSYMEIYNEKVHDLLAAQKGGAKDTRQELRLLEKDKGQVYVEGLEERMISDYQAAVDSIAEAQTFRRIGSTNANEFSSRSHTIFRVIIESRQKSNEDAAISVSYLNIVDLAGSENANQSGMGDRLLEGANINKSLHALSRVIFQLSEGKSEESDKHVSFRDSKLTRILKSSLGGNAKTLTLCMVAPCAVAETISTIKFAMSAKRVENRPVKNEVLTEDALLRRYKRENERLNKRLQATGVGQLESENVQLNEEVKRLREAVENMGKHIISGKSPHNSPYAKISEVNSSLETAKARIGRYEKQVDYLEKELTETKYHYVKQTEQLRKNQLENENLAAISVGLERDCRQHNSELCQIKKYLAEEEEDKEKLTRKVGELESNLKTAQEKIGDLQRELLEARRERQQ